LGLEINSRIEEELFLFSIFIFSFYLLDQNWKIWAH